MYYIYFKNIKFLLYFNALIVLFILFYSSYSTVLLDALFIYLFT